MPSTRQGEDFIYVYIMTWKKMDVGRQQELWSHRDICRQPCWPTSCRRDGGREKWKSLTVQQNWVKATESETRRKHIQADESDVLKWPRAQTCVPSHIYAHTPPQLSKHALPGSYLLNTHTHRKATIWSERCSNGKSHPNEIVSVISF